MKVRNGFVSNSSSSSFIVIADKGKELKASLKVDLSKMVDTVLRTQEDVCKYIVKKSWSDESFSALIKDKYIKKEYDEMMSYINDGKEVHVGSFCSDDDPLSGYLYEYGASDLELDGLKIIEE